MFKLPRVDPRSPVQKPEAIGLIPLIVLVSMVALIVWGWRQYREPARPPIQVPERMSPPAPPRAPPEPPRSIPLPAQRAQANLAAYFTDDDYPASAIRNEEQGRVAFRLRVSPEGRVTDCFIAESSGSSELDAATCRILQARARFRPARDASGVPVEDEIAGRMMWVLPAG